MGLSQLWENTALLIQAVLLKVNESNHETFTSLKLPLTLALGTGL